VDPEIPVPPRHYGGIERIVDMLARGLVARGHDVAMLAHPASASAGRLIPYEGASSRSVADTLRHARQLRRAIRAHRSDLVHSFGRLVYLLPVLPRALPKVQSYQRAVTPRSVRWGDRLAAGSLHFTACSASCARGGTAAGGRWSVIPNGVPAAAYSATATVPPDAPLVFLGRIERIKGAHTAIEVARRSGRRLVLAGNVVRDGGEHERYFEEEVAPHLDGERVRYVGPVDDAAKNRLRPSSPSRAGRRRRSWSTA
jgi:glycosyltransferase involved in cell wall biosynthesis